MIFDIPSKFSDELEEGGDLLGNYPTPTAWRVICTIGPFVLGHVPSNRKYYINHWEIRVYPPIIVSSLVFFSYYVYMSTIRHVLDLSNIWAIILTIYMFLFLLSYFMTIYEGPGYIPFYYPMEITNRSDNAKDYLSGLVVNKRQKQYLDCQRYPPRTSYFSSVNRIVIRPDHFCGWVGSFIGKRNHKLFFLFNFWGSFYIGHFSVLCTLAAFKTYEMNEKIDMFVTTASSILSIFFFLFLTGYFVVISCIQFSLNYTFFEYIKRRQRCTKNYISNWEEVMGSRDKWYLWLIPIGAFNKYDDVDIVNVHNYHEILL